MLSRPTLREPSSMYKRMSSRDYTNVLDVEDNNSEYMEDDMVQETTNPNWKLSLPHVLVATITSFLFGYHLGVVNEPLESISLDLGFSGDTLREGLVVSMCLGGAFVGSLFSGWIADSVGRRRAFQLSAVPMILGASMRVVNEPLENISLDLGFSGDTLHEGSNFDFEKFCSVSLSNLNIYACLVCGNYFQGRGCKSHAYTHSLEAGHHVYINLETEKVYCLPDGYEISDPSLDDIRHVLYPRFSEEQVVQLDKNKQWPRALDGSDYLPGMVGLNNIKETYFVNVTIQSLMQVTPLRNFFLILRTTKTASLLLFIDLGNSPERFGMHGTSRAKMPFLMLGLDLPPPPLFKDVMEKNIIPQVPLFNILKKFDGESVTEVVRPSIARMRYCVTRLPQYLILHMRRFTKNNFFVEKNPTVVNFPVKNLELKDYIPLPTAKDNEKLRSKYDLIANFVHDGKPGEGSYRVFVQRKSEELCYEDCRLVRSGAGKQVGDAGAAGSGIGSRRTESRTGGSSEIAPRDIGRQQREGSPLMMDDIDVPVREPLLKRKAGPSECKSGKSARVEGGRPGPGTERTEGRPGPAHRPR
ncbi:hypothetical protein IFM89_021918, partial [Coptis chinensis]